MVIADHRLEYVAKPTVLVALVVAAAAIPADRIDLVDRRWWFVAALVCCLVGDVLLMLPRDLFIPGLAAFLVGHVLFIVGFLQPPTDTAVLVLADRVGRGRGRGGRGGGAARHRAVPIAGGHHQTGLIAPVAVYVVAIVTMVVLAVNVADPIAAVGAGLFLVSDTLLALDRFVRPLPPGVVGRPRHLPPGPGTVWCSPCGTDRRAPTQSKLGGTFRLRFSSKKPGVPQTARTPSHSTPAASPFGAGVTTGPKKATPSTLMTGVPTS